MFDSLQRFRALVPGGNGTIYAVQADGELVWYRHLTENDPTHGVSWVSGGAGRIVGSGWHQFVTVLPGGNGILYGLRSDGSLLWYRYQVTDPNTGAGTWANGGRGSVIGTGFERYPRLFGGWGGVFYASNDNGDLIWYRYLTQDGTAGPGAWARGGAPATIGLGWQEFYTLLAEPDGTLYGVRQGETLWFYRYTAQDGSTGPGAWLNGGIGIQISSLFGERSLFRTLFTNGNHTIYGVQLDPDLGPDTRLIWYQLQTALPTVTWANDGRGVQVGTGFTVERTASLQSYVDSLAVAPGETLRVAVSTTWPNYATTVVRLSPSPDSSEVVVRGEQLSAGRLQQLPAGFRENGCGWQYDIATSLPSSCPPGIYAVRCQAPSGERFYASFVLRATSADRAKIAMLVNTNTWNAYNNWAGHDQYSIANARQLTFLRPNPNASPKYGGFLNHLTWLEVGFHNWLAANGYDADVYSDRDLHADPSWLDSYRVLILDGHSEYWSLEMRTSFAYWLNNGGNLLYLGANAIYERVLFTLDGNALQFRDPSNRRWLFRDQGMAEGQLLGVNFSDAAYMSFAQYRVVRNSPILAAAGLSVGQMFGASGGDGPPSGWEMDNMLAQPDLPHGDPSDIIAAGVNSAGAGANMIYVEPNTPNGGIVFGVGSLTFCPSLLRDPTLQTIVRTALDRCLA